MSKSIETLAKFQATGARVFEDLVTGRQARRTGLAVLAAVALACSGNEQPEPLPSQTATTVTPQIEEPPPLPPPSDPPIREVEPTRSSSVTVIEPGGSDPDRPTTLAEASRFAKARKGDPRQPIAVINDENLHQYAEGGDVIVLESEPAAPGPALPEESAEAEGSEQDPPAAGRGQDYWRSRALELRMGWRRTIDRIEELELEAAALRQQFYAEEDPYLRDSQLKPAWDRALDRLDQLRDRATRYQQDLDFFIEEGRRAGALQGWLNQGWELEPTEEERERAARGKLGEHESIDVPTLDEDDPP